jgi:PucR C-terminal helix-turn-helix domain/GGDEF-like domain
MVGKGQFAAYYPPVDSSSPSAAEHSAEVGGALVPRTAEMSADIYRLIVDEIPQLHGDRRVLKLLEASVSENVTAMLHIIQHGIGLENVHAPTAAAEYARRLAQRGMPVAALLRAYRIGSTRFLDWCLQELARRTDDASVVSAAGIRIAGVTAAYIDKVSEEVLIAYEAEKENWLRNLSVARAARVRMLLSGEQVDTDSAETVLGYRLRQHHVGAVAWITRAADSGALGRLEQAIVEAAVQAQCAGRPIFIPQDESSAWAWFPLGTGRTFPAQAATTGIAGGSAGLRFAFGAPAPGVAGFRRTHQQALSTHTVALAAGSSGQLVTSFDEVAPLALMAGSIDLLRAWVIQTLGALAGDDGNNARLRGTLSVFLQENGSYKATAERLTLHKNTVQYRIRKAEESLGRPVGEDHLHLELALLASHWLGPAVLRRDGTAPP